VPDAGVEGVALELDALCGELFTVIGPDGLAISVS
jgi:hypothetical protein